MSHKSTEVPKAEMETNAAAGNAKAKKI